jgi:hypothetical protein
VAVQQPAVGDPPASAPAQPAKEEKGMFGRIGDWFKRRGGN